MVNDSHPFFVACFLTKSIHARGFTSCGGTTPLGMLLTRFFFSFLTDFMDSFAFFSASAVVAFITLNKSAADMSFSADKTPARSSGDSMDLSDLVDLDMMDDAVGNDAVGSDAVGRDMTWIVLMEQRWSFFGHFRFQFLFVHILFILNKNRQVLQNHFIVV